MLSRRPARYQRSKWQLGNQWRYDPHVLSICKQIYEEASDLLYCTNFVIDIDNADNSPYEGRDLDRKWRGTNLTGRFPFHKAKQITIRVDACCGRGSESFSHMLYVCGLLRYEAKFIQHLTIEILHDRESWAFSPLWRSFGELDIAESFTSKRKVRSADEYDESSEIVEATELLLAPLALPQRVQACTITLADNLPTTPGLEHVVHQYEESMTDRLPIDSEDTQWLQDGYQSILDRLDEEKKYQHRQQLEKHEAWLIDTHNHRRCKHSSLKKYRRSVGKDYECDGCGKWHHWVLECRKCEERACTACMKSLKKHVSSAQKAEVYEAWLTDKSRDHCKLPSKQLKKYRRPCGKDAECPGCEKPFHWLLQCREDHACKWRACASCTSEVRRRRLQREKS
ncbi:MAG: hypothetical protein Q9168_003686 [Polycauliona sp. 1 TL-2023]